MIVNQGGDFSDGAAGFLICRVRRRTIRGTSSAQVASDQLIIRVDRVLLYHGTVTVLVVMPLSQKYAKKIEASLATIRDLLDLDGLSSPPSLNSVLVDLTRLDERTDRLAIGVSDKCPSRSQSWGKARKEERVGITGGGAGAGR